MLEEIAFALELAAGVDEDLAWEWDLGDDE